MGTIGSTVVHAIDISILNVDEDKTDENIRDLILTLGESQGANTEISTAVESSLSTSDELSLDHSGISGFSSRNDDDDNNDVKNYINNMGVRELTLPTSGNQLQECTSQYNSSLSILATLSSGNFLSGNEITEIFSRFVNIKKINDEF